MADTLLLDLTNWDLVLDVNGNIAIARPPYALAQDAASAVKTFQGECYYDTTLGIPYWETTLGKRPPTSLLKQQFINAALTVPGVVSAACFLSALSGRTLTGQIQITDNTGTTVAVSL